MIWIMTKVFDIQSRLLSGTNQSSFTLVLPGSSEVQGLEKSFFSQLVTSSVRSKADEDSDTLEDL